MMQQFSFSSYGNKVLPQLPADALRAGSFHKAPVIQGNNRDEMRFLKRIKFCHKACRPTVSNSRTSKLWSHRLIPAAKDFPMGAYHSSELAYLFNMGDETFTE